MLKAIRDFYHLTKLDRVIEPSDDVPPITHVKVFHKEYPRLPRVPLPAGSPPGEFDALSRARESIRGFADEPIRLTDLAGVLRSCRIVDPNREPERRTYPSAGARFPVETYVIAFRVTGLPAGCYHYAAAADALELLWLKDLSPRATEIVSPFVHRPAAALVLTAVIARSEVKYGAKAYPMSLLEAGHMGQNVLLACAGMGFGGCPVIGFVNDTLTSVLDLTEEELPIYVIALGKVRPPPAVSPGPLPGTRDRPIRTAP